MSEVGIVQSIFVAPDAGEPMEFTDAAMVEAGIGIIDDRYALGKGVFSQSKPKIRHVTLFEEEALEEANRERAVPFRPSDTRRNIMTYGVQLNNLVGKKFLVGSIAMRGTELCHPCERPSRLTGTPGFRERFNDRGGLRAEVLDSGLIVIGDVILA